MPSNHDRVEEAEAQRLTCVHDTHELMSSVLVDKGLRSAPKPTTCTHTALMPPLCFHIRRAEISAVPSN